MFYWIFCDYLSHRRTEGNDHLVVRHAFFGFSLVTVATATRTHAHEAGFS